MNEWTSVKKTGFPTDENIKYLCTIALPSLSNNERTVEILSFSKDLYGVNKYDFPEYKEQKKQGFYTYFFNNGYGEIDVISWMPMPEAYDGD